LALELRRMINAVVIWAKDDTDVLVWLHNKVIFYLACFPPVCTFHVIVKLSETFYIAPAVIIWRDDNKDIII
jgi:hypothetical protein